MSDIHSLGGAALVAQIQTECNVPPRSRTRTRTELDALTRTAPLRVAELQSRKPNEQTLQWMFVRRCYLLHPSERVLARELPTCCAGDPVIGRADLLAFDIERLQPLLVELKKTDAGDPLAAVVLELLSHWVFHVRYQPFFHSLLADFGYAPFRPIRLIIAAPERYFAETRARSTRRGRLNGEFETALSWIDDLHRTSTVDIDLYAIEDRWQTVGTEFLIRRITA